MFVSWQEFGNGQRKLVFLTDRLRGSDGGCHRPAGLGASGPERPAPARAQQQQRLWSDLHPVQLP